MDNLINLRKISGEDTPSEAQPLSGKEAVLASAPAVTARIHAIPTAPAHEQAHDIVDDDDFADVGSIRWAGTLYNHSPHMLRVWIMISALFGIAILVYFWQHNIIASILFVLLGFTLLMHVKKDKDIFEFEVSDIGVSINDKLYKYHDIESFWIDYHPQYHIKELSMHLKKRYLPYVKIPLYDINPVQVREIMIDFIPEIHHPCNLADVMSRKLGI